MQKCMKEDSPNPTLKAVVALLKLGDWDPDVFYKFRDTILNQVGGHCVREHCTDMQRQGQWPRLGPMCGRVSFVVI